MVNICGIFWWCSSNIFWGVTDLQFWKSPSIIHGRILLHRQIPDSTTKNSVISRQKSSDAFLGEAIIPLEFYNVNLADNNYYEHIKLRLTRSVDSEIVGSIEFLRRVLDQNFLFLYETEMASNEIPRSPRATINASDTRKISSKLTTPSWFSRENS